MNFKNLMREQGSVEWSGKKLAEFMWSKQSCPQTTPPVAKRLCHHRNAKQPQPCHSGSLELHCSWELSLSSPERSLPISYPPAPLSCSLVSAMALRNVSCRAWPYYPLHWIGLPLMVTNSNKMEQTLSWSFAACSSWRCHKRRIARCSSDGASNESKHVSSWGMRSPNS